MSARSGRMVLGRRRVSAGAVAASRRVLVLGVCCAGVLGVVGVAPAAAETKAKACRPREGAQGKARFTVWYCEGDGCGQALAPAVAILLDAVWPRETAPEPNGLGPPITPKANGGRISVYVTAPNEAVHLGKCPDFCGPIGAANGFARPVAPFSKNRDGGPTSSGALVINEKKGLTDATVIHEFLHVLQMAPNGRQWTPGWERRWRPGPSTSTAPRTTRVSGSSKGCNATRGPGLTNREHEHRGPEPTCG